MLHKLQEYKGDYVFSRIVELQEKKNTKYKVMNVNFGHSLDRLLFSAFHHDLIFCCVCFCTRHRTIALPAAQRD